MADLKKLTDEELLAQLQAPAPESLSDEELLSQLSAPAPTELSDDELLAQLGQQGGVPTSPEIAPAGTIASMLSGREFENGQPVQDTTTAFRSGIREGIAGQILNVAEDTFGLGDKESIAARNFQPLTTAETVAQVAGNFVDPIGDLIGYGVIKNAAKIPGIKQLSQRSALLAKTRQTAQLELNAGIEAAEDSFRKAARQYAATRIAQSAATGGVAFGAFAGSQEAARQIAEQDLDPIRLAETTFMSSAMGMALGPLGGTIGRKLFGDDVLRKATAEAEQGFLKNLDVQAGDVRTLRALDDQSTELALRKLDLEEKLQKRTKDLSEAQAAQTTKQLQNVEALLEESLAKRDEVIGVLRSRGSARVGEVDDQISDVLKRLSAGTESLSKGETSSLQKIIERGVKRENKLAPQLRAAVEARDALAARIRSNPYISPSSPETKQLEKLSREVTKLENEMAKTPEVENLQAFLAGGKKPVTLSRKTALDKELKQLKRKREFMSQKTERQVEQRVAEFEAKEFELLERRRQIQNIAESGQRALTDNEVLKTQGALAQVESQLTEVTRFKNAALDDLKDLVQQGKGISRFETFSAQMTKREFVDKVLDTSKRIVEDGIKRGIFKEEDKLALIDGFFSDVYSKRFNYDKMKLDSSLSGFFRKFVNSAERANRTDRRLGTGLGRVVVEAKKAEAATSNDAAEFVQNLNAPALQLMKKMGVSAEEIGHYLQYIETRNGVQVFNPAETPFRLAYSGNVPAEQVLLQYPELGQIRATYDDLLNQLPADVMESIGYVNGYIPSLQARGQRVPTGSGRIGDSRFLHKREAKQLLPGVNEFNVLELNRAYANQLARFKNYRDVIPAAYGELTKLSMLGEGGEAKWFAEQLGSSLQLASPKAELTRAFADAMLAQNSAVVKEMLMTHPQADDVYREIGRFAKDSMYQSLILGNLKNIIFQFFQPLNMGAAEVGVKHIAKAQAGMKSLGSADHAFASQFDKVLNLADPGELGKAGLQAYKSKTLAVGERAVNLSLGLGIPRRLFSASEKRNRRIVFAAGYNQFKEASKLGPEALDAAMQTLLEGEKATVRRAFQEGGEEAAAQAYGVIRSYRANFHYGLVDKPQILNNDLGKLIPFTTWSTNNLSRLVGDIQNQNVKQAAKRIAIPIMAMTALKELTGYDFQLSNPVSDSAGVGNLSVLPLVSAPMEELSMRGDVMGAVNAGLRFTPVGAYQTAVRRYRRNDDDLTSALIGVDRVDKKEKGVKRLVPKIFKKLAKDVQDEKPLFPEFSEE